MATPALKLLSSGCSPAARHSGMQTGIARALNSQAGSENEPIKSYCQRHAFSLRGIMNKFNSTRAVPAVVWLARAASLAALLAGFLPCPRRSRPKTRNRRRRPQGRRRRQCGAAHRPNHLADAIARGIKYNLDHRTRMMEEALAIGQLDLGRYDMLPSWSRPPATSGATRIVTNSGIRSPACPPLANPISSGPFPHLTDLAPVLERARFGVSYYNLGQNADRVLIATERRRQGHAQPDPGSAHCRHWRRQRREDREGSSRNHPPG